MAIALTEHRMLCAVLGLIAKRVTEEEASKAAADSKVDLASAVSKQEALDKDDD